MGDKSTRPALSHLTPLADIAAIRPPWSYQENLRQRLDLQVELCSLGGDTLH